MTNTEQFNTIVRHLSEEDFDTIRAFIRDTVRAEWGGLIDNLSERSYNEPDDGPRYADYAQKGMPEDPFIEKGPEPTEVPSRSYDLSLQTRTDKSVTFSNDGADGPVLTVGIQEWESAGSPNRIKIVASLA